MRSYLTVCLPLVTSKLALIAVYLQPACMGSKATYYQIPDEHKWLLWISSVIFCRPTRQ